MESAEQAVISTSEVKGKAPRKAKVKPTDQAKGKRSLNLSLDQDTYERLAVHAMRRDITLSELVSQLAREHLREFHITRTATRTANGE